MKDIFIVGSKGIPAQYGGFETFVDNLVSRKVNKNIKYHVSCMTFDKKAKNYNYYGAECQEINIPDIGGSKAIFYDLRALNWALLTIKERNLYNGIIYILACRIGPFLHRYITKFHKYGFEVWVNPDGHEWKRAKWSIPVRKYWKVSERLMVKNSDFLICDSKSIENYIHKDYGKYNPKTTFISYGTDVTPTNLTFRDEVVRKWYRDHQVKSKNYFLIVGRFVPENNYETMIREFKNSNTSKDLVIITNLEKNSFFKKLKEATHFDEDERIKFVGTVYNKSLLKFIRENAFCYIHGHSVGGTNPSLLEALGSTKLNLLYDISFNKEVGGEGAMYWTKKKNDLRSLISKVDKLTNKEINFFDFSSTKRVLDEYSWPDIITKYEKEFKVRK